MSASSLRRLFGDYNGTGTGPDTWRGGDEGQTRKVKLCDLGHPDYSVSSDDCPICRDALSARLSAKRAAHLRSDIAVLRSRKGHCRYCGDLLSRRRGQHVDREYCDHACAKAKYDEGRAR